jgi:hypothetical protein
LKSGFRRSRVIPLVDRTGTLAIVRLEGHRISNHEIVLKKVKGLVYYSRNRNQTSAYSSSTTVMLGSRVVVPYVIPRRNNNE